MHNCFSYTKLYFRLFIVLFVAYTSVSCGKPTPLPAIRVVLINLQSTPTPSSELPTSPVPTTGIGITQIPTTDSVPTQLPPTSEFTLTASMPKISGCNCNGMPTGVTVELYVSGGFPPYTLEGYDKTFNDSYTIPIDKNIRSLTLSVSSNDGQKDKVTIDISPCTPPKDCGVSDPQLNNPPSTDPPPTDPPPTDPPPTDPPPTDCPTKNPSGKPDCGKKNS